MTAGEKRLLALTLVTLLGVLATSRVIEAFRLPGPVTAVPFILAVAFLGFASALVQALWERRR